MARDWSFAVRPGWLASHLFAGALIVGFVFAGFWQLDRLGQRKDENIRIMERSLAEPLSVEEALDTRETDALDYVAIVDSGQYLDGELIRVANRSQDGIGGDWVVALFETDDGRLMLVNRGFSPRDDVAAEPPTSSSIQGWMRASRVKDSFFGATDTGQGERVPRLDVEAIGDRFDLGPDLAPAWLQLDDPNAEGIPQPVPLPAIDEGNHFSYAMQWFTFAALSVLIYGLLLRKKAGEVDQDELGPDPALADDDQRRVGAETASKDAEVRC